ncbi:Ap3d1 protein [Crepidotus variabilis]|uniref:AP-3 complex subunit delta n=1 Tax=Crepidotus variabilis TaxID=179855 RepID=A0A9P6ELR3_9AGAR|nr:Ap3d1 protein [Crepidotus variabilis]
MWERTLQDLVRGLRANKNDEAKFIGKAVDEIRQEIKNDDMELKAGAVLKLTYLDMLGYDMSWASFHVVEVMSSPKFHLKCVGYLAATQSFDQETDVLMLTTNLLKKDLGSTPADISVTLDGLSHIVTTELARDLSPELIAMLNHSRPQIRKRAILALYKLVLKNPDTLQHARVRLEDKLEDPDPAVVAATVNIICELARQNPKEFLSLAPQLFHLLTTSSNNWMLIKIIKLFGSLSPHEPRLVKKLQPPITELISTTPAISLLYECVHTCIIGGMLQGPQGDSLARMCVSKLATFIQDPDQNLKYIALQAMAKIVPSHPHLVADYQDTILSSVNDQDISIRMRALELVSAMVDRDNLQSIVQQLLAHLVKDSSMMPTASQILLQNSASPTSSPPSPSQSPGYRLILSQRILAVGSQSTYENVANFEWYISVLVDLAHVANVDIGVEIRDQLVEIVGRVRGVRPFAVKLMSSLLADDTMLRNANEPGSCSEVLWAAAWICGEHCSALSDPQKLLPHLLQPEVDRLSPNIIATYIQAVLKVFGTWASELAQRWSEDDLPIVKEKVINIKNRLEDLSGSSDIETQERASNALQLFSFISADLNSHRSRRPSISAASSLSMFEETSITEDLDFPKSLYLIDPLFSSHELNPVANSAQASVPVPEGLDLDSWIVAPPPEPTGYKVVDQADDSKKKKGNKGKEKEKETKTSAGKKTKKHNGEAVVDGDLLVPVESDIESPEDIEKRKAERQAQLRDDPYYIVDDRSTKPLEEVESIPVVHLEDMPPIPHESRLPSLRTTSQSFSSQSFVIEKDGEMPEGAILLATPKLSTPASGSSRSATPARLTSFQPYEIADDAPRPQTPEAVTVLRTKKKGTAAKKKKTIS